MGDNARESIASRATVKDHTPESRPSKIAFAASLMRRRCVRVWTGSRNCSKPNQGIGQWGINATGPILFAFGHWGTPANATNLTSLSEEIGGVVDRGASRSTRQTQNSSENCETKNGRI